MIVLTENMRSRSVSIALCDLTRLSKYKNKSEIIRRALDLFIEKETTTRKDTEQKDITETIICFGMEIKKLDYLESICKDTENESRRYFSVSEIFRIAIRDYWIEENKLEKVGNHDLIKPEYKKELNYIERNGIKVIRVLK